MLKCRGEVKAFASVMLLPKGQLCGGNVHGTDLFMVTVKYVSLQAEHGNVVGDLFSQPQHLMWFCLILPNIILGKEIA